MRTIAVIEDDQAIGDAMEELLRREAPGREPVLTAGDLRLDCGAMALTVSGQEVRLTRTEYAILRLLMERPRQVLARSVLLDSLSADTPDGTERSLKQHISNLRRKLQAAGGVDYIETVWGIGYRLSKD